MYIIYTDDQVKEVVPLTRVREATDGHTEAYHMASKGWYPVVVVDQSGKYAVWHLIIITGKCIDNPKHELGNHVVTRSS